MIKIVFLSSSDIAINAFEYFIKSSDYEVLGLVSQPNRAKNRGHKVVVPNIVNVANNYNIPVFQPEKL
ncbi:methionyl-tRNA formyltransferase, partial [bacterium]|nr:methionyl-tRNA formyltransferase [bacterium]